MTPHRTSGLRPLWLPALILLSFGCGGKVVPPSSPIVAMVADEGISFNEFKKAFLELEVKGTLDEDSASIKELKQSLINQLIERRLFLAEAVRLKLEVGTDELRQAVERIMEDYAVGEFETMLKERKVGLEEWKEQIRKELLIEKVTQQSVPENIQISDEEVRLYYLQHEKDYMRPKEIRARQIVVAKEESARELLRSLSQGADFAALANERSLSPDRERGGDLGFFAQGEMPEEFDVVFTLGVGKISDIVKTAYGYHLFKVEAWRPARPMSPAEAAERIRAQLSQERREKMFAAWVAGLKERARISINYQILYQPIHAPEASRVPAHD